MYLRCHHSALKDESEMTQQDKQAQESHLIEHSIKSELVHQGSFLQVRLDTVRLPHGGQATREYVVHPGAVVVIGRKPATARGNGPMPAPCIWRSATPTKSFTSSLHAA